MASTVSADYRVIADAVGRIVGTVDPLKIVLFGSRARGDARPDSDYDLLVIAESDEPRYRRSAPLYTALADIPFETEIVVYTPDEVQQWAAVPEAFVTTAIREGRVLYEKQERLGEGLVAESAE